MPYRQGIISNTDDYVGETAALNRKLRKTKGARVPVLHHFDSEEELFYMSDTLDRNESNDNSIMQARQKYQAYWGAVKREEMTGHLDHYQACIPTTQRDWSCGMCRCGHGRFKCVCDSGKKMLSPTRVVYINSHIAWQTRNLIYEVGTGIYVPKTHPEIAPDWRELDWSI